MVALGNLSKARNNCISGDKFEKIQDESSCSLLPDRFFITHNPTMWIDTFLKFSFQLTPERMDWNNKWNEDLISNNKPQAGPSAWGSHFHLIQCQQFQVEPCSGLYNLKRSISQQAHKLTNYLSHVINILLMSAVWACGPLAHVTFLRRGPKRAMGIAASLCTANSCGISYQTTSVVLMIYSLLRILLSLGSLEEHLVTF